MEQTNRGLPTLIKYYPSDELEQVYPHLSPSPSISAAADVSNPFEVDADHELPGFFDLSHEEFERQVLLDLATNPSGSSQQIIDRDPYERLGPIASESEQVNPQLPSSPSGPAADANGPFPDNGGHVGNPPLEMACDKGCNGLVYPNESEQVNPDLPASPGSVADVNGPRPVNADNLRDLSPEGGCDKKCNGDLVGPHQCQRPKRGLRIICLTNDCVKEYTTKNDFNRHCKTVHKLKQLLVYCTVAGCKRGGKGFSRQDNLTQHLRRSHGENIVKKHFKVHGQNWGFDDV